MTQSNQKDNRSNLRAQGYNYAQAGAYFVTIVLHGRRSLFGEIIDDEMWLNEPGKMVEKVWLETPSHYKGVYIGAHVVMPNHFHGIVILGEDVAAVGLLSEDSNRIETHLRKIPLDQNFVGATPCGCPVSDWVEDGQAQGPAPTEKPLSLWGDVHRTVSDRVEDGQARGPAPTEKPFSLPDIVHRFKSLTTHHYIEGVIHYSWKPFDRHLWQRSYYDHIIRNERDLQAVTDYILTNPQNWQEDEEFTQME